MLQGFNFKGGSGGGRNQRTKRDITLRAKQEPNPVRPRVHRGYYMAARRYEISLRVLKNVFSTREEKFRISERPCNVLFMKYQIIANDVIYHVTMQW